MNDHQLHRAAVEMESGRHGSFSAALAVAYFAADTHNRERLIAAFGDLFERAHQFTRPRLEIIE